MIYVLIIVEKVTINNKRDDLLSFIVKVSILSILGVVLEILLSYKFF